ncbi:hypothetical protein ACHAXT_008461 [Thalassiosira profunda]
MAPPKRPRLLAQPDVRIGVVGGGLAGLAAALAMLRGCRGANEADAGRNNCKRGASGGGDDNGGRRFAGKIVIYERDARLSDRKEGYGMTLTYDPSGPLAKLGILEELAGRDCPSRCHYLFDEKGNVRGYFGNAFYAEGSNNGDDGNRSGGRGAGQRGNLRVPRAELRSVLRDALLAEAARHANQDGGEDCAGGGESSVVEIVWNKRLRSYFDRPLVDKLNRIHSGGTKNEDNNRVDGQGQRPVSLQFEDGSVDEVDLLVGADGVNSVVAKQYLSTTAESKPAQSANHVRDASPRFLGIFLVLGISDHFHPLIDERGFYTLDGTHRLFIMPFQGSRLDDDADVPAAGETTRRRRRTMWQLSFPVDRKEAARLGNLSSEELRREVLRRCGHWHAPFPAMVKDTPSGTIWGTSLVDRDPQSFLDHRAAIERHGRVPSRVVLLGDAAHSMTPFKGQGANQALADGPLLAEWLGKAKVDSAVRGFVTEMARRSGVKVRASREAARRLHSKECWGWMATPDKPERLRPQIYEAEQQKFTKCEEVFLPLMDRLTEAKDAGKPKAVLKCVNAMLERVELLSPSFLREYPLGILVKTVRKSMEGEYAEVKPECKRLATEIHRVFFERDKKVSAGFVPVKNRKDAPKKADPETKEAPCKAVFHGVRAECVSELLRTLKARRVGAAMGSELDCTIRSIIRELDIADTSALVQGQISQQEMSRLCTQALEWASKGNVRQLRQLSRRSHLIIPAARDARGRTCLHLAAAGGHIDACRWLLSEVNASCDALDESGRLPVDLAREAGKDETVQLLTRWAEQSGPTCDTTKGADAPSNNAKDAYRQIEKELRGIRTERQLWQLLQNNRRPPDSMQTAPRVTHVLGCHVDASDAEHDVQCVKALAEDHGAVLLRNFVPREVDQLALGVCALRPMNYDIAGALDTLRSKTDDATFNAISGIGLSELLSKSQRKRANKVLEEVKSSLAVPSDAAVVVQTNFGPQLQSYVADKSPTSKKRRIDSFPLSRLRYLNLGEWNYNWGDRRYEKVPQAKPLESRIVSLAQRAHAIARQKTKEVSAAPVPFDMAICNLYHLSRPSDRLGGHRDDVESNLALPLVTISLGAPGIFLLGGNSREDAPTAILLRAGDCMVMSGQSRGYFHGVPTILEQEADGAGCLNASAADAVESAVVFPEMNAEGVVEGNAANAPALDEMRFVKAFLSTVRMNVSVRQV